MVNISRANSNEVSVKSVEVLLENGNLKQVLMTMDFQEKPTFVPEAFRLKDRDDQRVLSALMCMPEERFCQQVLKELHRTTATGRDGRPLALAIEPDDQTTLNQSFFYVPTDAQTLIADAALKELARNDGELVRSVNLDDPDLMTDLAMISSMPLPQGEFEKLDNAHRNTVAKNRQGRQQGKAQQPQQNFQKTTALAAKPQVMSLFKDCQDSLKEIQSVIAARFPADPQKADQIAAEGLEKAFAASSKTVETAQKIQKTRSASLNH